jgi:hypothetical protein
MTPEELNRTVEFIIASQARLAAAQVGSASSEHDPGQAPARRLDRLLAGHLVSVPIMVSCF